MTGTDLHILFAEPFETSAVQRARRAGRVSVLDRCDESSLCERVSDCDALLVRTQATVTRRVIERAKRLRVIGRGGSGVDNIDVEAAGERGIVVVNTPDASTEAVADLTLGLMIAVLRRIVSGDAAVRSGRFLEVRSECIGPEISHLTIGILGLGRIGKAVGRRCHHGFNMRVLYYDIVRMGLLDFVATPVSMERLWRESDIISLHVPLTEKTRGLVDAQALSMCKPGSVLINTARGGVVSCSALADALRNGPLNGAGLDVVDPEPLPANHPLFGAPNVVFTPHLGAKTHRAEARINEVVDDCVGVLMGKKPCNPV